MIGYTTFGSNDIKKAVAFYDEIFALIGAKRVHNYDSFVAWGMEVDEAFFAVTLPFNKEHASVGNGTMVAIKAADENQVKSVHEKALSLGGVDEGAPGIRQGSYYCAYFRDLDGNKLNFYCLL